MIEAGYSLLEGSRISLRSREKSASLPEFLKNEVVEGKVLKSFSSDSVLLLIKGKRVVAKTHVPMREKNVLLLKVEETAPHPILKLQGTKSLHADNLNLSMILSTVKDNLWKTVLENINALDLTREDKVLFKELINDLSMRLFLKPHPDLLRILIDKLGLGWEAKLRKICVQKTIEGNDLSNLISDDLKGLGSKFFAFTGTKDTILHKFISSIENIQLLNHLGMERESKIFIPIPMQFPDGLFNVGQLLIHLDQQKKDAHDEKKGESLYRVSFLLELSNFGPLRADITIRGNEIGGRFLLTNKAAKLILEENIPFLVSNLKEKGFYIQYLECLVKAPETIRQTLIEEIVQHEGCTISLMA